MLQTGDIVFVKGTSWISKIIQKLTRGEMSHVGILYDEDTIFETDGRWGKAQFHDLYKHRGKSIEIYRYRRYTSNDLKLIKALCEEYEGAPYSYWDIVVKGALFWLPRGPRGTIAAFVGTKAFMICNELVMRILYSTYRDEKFKHYESSNPSQFHQLIRSSLPKTFERVL